MLSPGTLLGGRYRIETLVGEGGMGAVYEAVQQDLDRRVALKILHEHLTDDVELRSRFQREARVVAMLGHPNVVQISDFQARDGEPPFFVMELLHGENLRDLLKRAQLLPPERVAYIAVQVLSALEAAHRASVVHRDIKPDNIFLERTDVQVDIVKVLDFGVAKLLGRDDMKLTREGLVVGTLSYMAPEQALGDRSPRRCTSRSPVANRSTARRPPRS
jgi:serine/threonine-protein kinase